MKNNEIDTVVKDEFLKSVSDVLTQARKKAKTAVNLSMVYAYFEIGRMIVEEEQQGKNRAAYGQQLLKELSAHLTKTCGKGFSVGNLKNIRQFYKVYSTDQIGETVFSQFENFPAVCTGRKFFLSWSHYLKLMRIENVDERHFYEIESVKNDWSLRELQRQFDSALYQRLLLSTEKENVKQLAKKGQIIEKSSDLVKDPYVLEFLGLEEKSGYSESDLETRIIDNLQTFLLELGAGYTFVARQKRFTFNESHFRADLVFYNRLLRCFVVFDLKIGMLKHQDLGQMQMYVNYYDRYEKQADENPTIGVLLCQDKDDALVELTLPKDSNIYASQYQLYLPDKKLLQKKLQEWIDEEIGGGND
jgi:predicted nuclease of restriction endonuclease-like (RecB) superfamily